MTRLGTDGTSFSHAASDNSTHVASSWVSAPLVRINHARLPRLPFNTQHPINTQHPSVFGTLKATLPELVELQAYSPVMGAYAYFACCIRKVQIAFPTLHDPYADGNITINVARHVWLFDSAMEDLGIAHSLQRICLKPVGQLLYNRLCAGVVIIAICRCPEAA